jgi:hypothetical protein
MFSFQVLITEDGFYKESGILYNKNVDIKFSAHYAFLE